MILDRCTDEFKRIYNRYRRQLKEVHKVRETLDVQKILEERNKQLIDNVDEEELLHEEALEGLLKLEGGGSDDKAIHHRIKMQNNLHQGSKRKKFQKKSLLHILDDKEIDLNHFERKDTIFNTFSTSKTFISNTNNSPTMSPNISPKLTLPLIGVVGGGVFQLNEMNNSNNFNNSNNLQETPTHDKLQKIQNIIETNPKIKKKLAKSYNDKIMFELRQQPGALSSMRSVNKSKTHKRNKDILLDYHKEGKSANCNSNNISNYILQTNTSTKESINPQFNDLTSRVHDEYMKVLRQVASKDETGHLLKVIDKQNRLKDYMVNIENIESKVLKAKERSTSIVERYEKRRNYFKIKLKRMLGS